MIYFWKSLHNQFWLFTVYDKDESDDLTMEQRKRLRDRLQLEIKARGAAT